MNSEQNLNDLFQEVPVLKILGVSVHISQDIPYDMDDDVQIVCKYLIALKLNLISTIIEEDSDDSDDGSAISDDKKIQFSNLDDLSSEVCNGLLKEYMPPHVQASKITQKLFIKYV